MAALTPLPVNGWSSTVQAGSSAIGSASATGINVASGDGAGLGTVLTNGFTPAVVTDSTGSTIKEYVWITARSTDALTVVRQAEDSTRFPASTTSIQSGYKIYAVASRQTFGSSNINPEDHGLCGWTFDPVQITTSGQAIGSGFIYVAKVPIRRTVTIASIMMKVMTAGTGFTASQNFAGIYDSSGTNLATSADLSTTWGTNGLKTIAMTTPPTIVGGPGVYVYASFLVGATGLPAFQKWNTHTVSSQNDLLNAGMTAGTTGFRCATTGGSKTSLSNFTPSTDLTTSTTLFWLGLVPQ